MGDQFSTRDIPKGRAAGEPEENTASKEVPGASEKPGTGEQLRDKVAQFFSLEVNAEGGKSATSPEALSRNLSASLDSLHSLGLEPEELNGIKQLGQSMLKGDLSGVQAFVAANKNNESRALMTEELNHRLSPAGVFAQWHDKQLAIGLSGMPTVRDPKNDVLLFDGEKATVQKRDFDKLTESLQDPRSVFTDFSQRLTKNMAARQKILDSVSESTKLNALLFSGEIKLDAKEPVAKSPALGDIPEDLSDIDTEKMLHSLLESQKLKSLSPAEKKERIKENHNIAAELVSDIAQGKIGHLVKSIQSGKYDESRLAEIARMVNQVSSDSSLKADFSKGVFAFKYDPPVGDAYSISVPKSGFPHGRIFHDEHRKDARLHHAFLRTDPDRQQPVKEISVQEAVQHIQGLMIEGYKSRVF